MKLCVILNKGNNSGFDMTIKRCICRFKTLFFRIYARRQVLFSCIHKCICRSPKLCTIKKDIKATTIQWTFYGLFSLFWNSMLDNWWFTYKNEICSSQYILCKFNKWQCLSQTVWRFKYILCRLYWQVDLILKHNTLAYSFNGDQCIEC